MPMPMSMSKPTRLSWAYALILSLLCAASGRAETPQADGDSGLGLIITVIVIVVIGVYSVYLGIIVVKEKETVVIERFGQFHSLLTPGFHCVIPYVDRRKYYKWRYFESKGGNEVCVNKKDFIISTQQEVMDFPSQPVISRDNALIHLDCVLAWKIVSPKKMIYSTINLPYMLSKLLQAQVRNVAGNLDVDQIIDDTTAMSAIQGTLDSMSMKWGVHIEFVKIQKVEAGNLSEVLARKKEAELKNKQVIINAKMVKQTKIIEAEGNRDRMIKEEQGALQQAVSRARGQAQAILNNAMAEKKVIEEVSKTLASTGEDPTLYLMSLKYIEALEKIVNMNRTVIQVMPKETTFVQSAQMMGLNTVVPSK